MTDTARMSLPLLAPAQAQKHVTVNEALARIDGLNNPVLVSATLATPPAAAPDGALYAVPPGAVNEWAGQQGMLALRMNGGWIVAPTQRGWRAFIEDEGVSAIWDGEAWRRGAVTLGAGGAAAGLRLAEFDLSIAAGATVTTPVVIPARAILFGVTGRVTTTITGTATAWSLGVAGDTGRFGTGLGLAQNSWVNGPAAPIVYWTPTALEITATGGIFAAGALRLAVHYAELSLPDPV